MSSPSPGFDPLRRLRELVADGRFQEALDAYRGAEEGDARRQPEARLLAGTAALRLGELDVAVSLVESALDGFRARGDADGRMRATNLLGAIAFERGRLDEAERRFREALALARELDDTLMAARASNNLASVAHLRGRPDEALGLYRSALLAHQRLGDRRGAAETCHNLGLTFRQLADWPHAEDAVSEAVRHAALVGERSLLALVIAGRAELELERGEYEMARQALARSAELAHAAGDGIGAAEVGRLRALLALRVGDYPGAAREAEAARAEAERLGSALLQAECAAAAARAWRALGHAEEAEARRAEAERLFRSLGAVRLLEDLAASWR